MPDDLRAGICLVGLISAPAQSGWVYAQLCKWAEQHFLGSSSLDPEAELALFKAHLLSQRADMWVVPCMHRPRSLCVCTATSSIEVKVQGPVTVQQLLAAELRLHSSNARASLSHAHRALGHSALLHEQVGYDLEICLPEPARSVTALEVSQSGSPGNGVFTDALIWAVLKQLAALASSTTLLLSPIVADLLSSLRGGHSPSQTCLFEVPAEARILTIFLHENHWTCLLLWRHQASLEAKCRDGILGRNLPAATAIVTGLATLACFKVGQVSEACLFSQEDEMSCGLVALLHAATALAGPGDAHTLLQAALSKASPGPACRAGFGGLSKAQEEALSEILVSRGVPASAVAERIKDAVSKLGSLSCPGFGGCKSLAAAEGDWLPGPVCVQMGEDG